MIQLAFQPAFDAFHAVFRLLRLRALVPLGTALPRDHIRIIDFYLMFPSRIGHIRLMPSHRGLRKIAAAHQSLKPYAEQPDDLIAFNRMEPMQTAALETLAVNEFIELSQLELGEVRFTEKVVPERILNRIQESNADNPELLSALRVLALEYTLTGSNGLKSRTGLMEHRYDAV